MDDVEIGLEEFFGHLREMYGRVVGADIRDATGAVVANMEGEFTQLDRVNEGVEFQVGGVPRAANMASSYRRATSG